MNFLNDDNFKFDSNYCTYCHNGDHFSNSEISLEDFKVNVGEQLRKKGFNEKHIAKHLKKMHKLRRWRKKFDWTN